MRTTIHAYPGEITLLAIGPLTNVGLLFALDPKTASLLRGLMLMGGSFEARTPEDEWNIVCDPHAAARVFQAPLELTSVGVDVTGQCRLSGEDYRRRFEGLGGPFAFVAEMAAVYFAGGAREVVFHDPLAAALLFDPGLCETRTQRIAVELTNERTFGRTHPAGPGDGPPHHVAFRVDAPRFFAHYFSVADR